MALRLPNWAIFELGRNMRPGLFPIVAYQCRQSLCIHGLPKVRYSLCRTDEIVAVRDATEQREPSPSLRNGQVVSGTPQDNVRYMMT